MSKTNKSFISLKNHKGIRKDVVTGKYVARKTIKGKQYCETFKSISDATRWRNDFHPLLTNTEVKLGEESSSRETNVKIQSRPNGVDKRFTFGEVWTLYQEQYFPLLEKQVAKAKQVKHKKRNNFDNDLKCLKALFNWYRENYDGMFVVPILKRHKAMGVIRKVPKRNSKKMTLEQVNLFLDSFDNQFWRDFAEVHFYMAGRSQEVGGLQWESVDFKDGLIQVADVAIWGENKRFTRLKEIPKNGEERIVYMNSRLIEILGRRFNERSSIPCEFFRESTGERLNFVFEIEGEPVTYRAIQYQYNKALKKAGLFQQFKSTHILRKAMANIVRKEMGLDAAQAVGGWKSREIVEKTYTDAPRELNKKAVEFVEKLAIGDNVNSSLINSKIDEICSSFSGLKLIKCDEENL